MARGSIDASTLRGMPGRDERVVVVDVRKAEEHARGSVPGRTMDGLGVPEGARVVTVCNRGHAAAAAEQLRGQGHDAVHLEGGMDAWRAP